MMICFVCFLYFQERTQYIFHPCFSIPTYFWQDEMLKVFKAKSMLVNMIYFTPMFPVIPIFRL